MGVGSEKGFADSSCGFILRCRLLRVGRLLSITLLLLFALAPLAALGGQDAERRLPVCCRRGGAHHCAMGMSEGSSGDRIREICPSFPHASALVSHAQDWLFDASGLNAGTTVAETALFAVVELGYRKAFGGSRWTRGPPLLIPVQFGAICLVAACCLAVWRARNRGARTFQLS